MFDQKLARSYGFCDWQKKFQPKAKQIIAKWDNQKLTLDCQDQKLKKEMQSKLKDHLKEALSPAAVLELFSEGHFDALMYEDEYLVFPVKAQRYLDLLLTSFQNQEDSKIKELEIDCTQLTKPSDAFCLNLIGKIFLTTKQNKKALNTFSQANQLLPEFSEPYNNLGIMLWNVGQKREALVMFADAFSKNPFLKTASLNFFDAAYELKEYGVIVQLIESFIAQNIFFDEFYHHLAIGYFHLGEHQKTKQTLDKILAKNPQDKEAQILKEQFEKKQSESNANA